MQPHEALTTGVARPVVGTRDVPVEGHRHVEHGCRHCDLLWSRSRLVPAPWGLHLFVERAATESTGERGRGIWVCLARSRAGRALASWLQDHHRNLTSRLPLTVGKDGIG